MFTRAEQRVFIKVQVARGRNARQIHKGLREACGDSALPYRTVARWTAAFEAGRQSADKEHGGGRIRTATDQHHVEALRTLLEHDRRWTCSELANELNISSTSVYHMLTHDLGMRKIAARWVPHVLTEVQKWHRWECARVHLERYAQEGVNFLHRIIAIDETWGRSYEPEPETWGLPRMPQSILQPSDKAEHYPHTPHIILCGSDVHFYLVPHALR